MEDKDFIISSDIVKNELLTLGYSRYDLDILLFSLRYCLKNVSSTDKQYKRSRDIASKRKIPFADTFHALIARDNGAIMITRDKHFDLLKDIVKVARPEDII